MTRRTSTILLSACAFAFADAHAETGDFRGSVKAEVASAYLSTSSGLLDTRPVATQRLDGHLSLGDFGFIEGYVWTISSLHTMQRERHRVLFYDVDTSVRYGYQLALAEDMRLKTSAGPYFDLPFGYRGASLKCWGPYVVQRLANPWIVPYWSGLWIVERSRRARVCVGMEKQIALSERLAIAPFAEVVWMDERRFSRRYGEKVDRRAVCGGALSHTLVGLKARWLLGENFCVIASAAMSDVVNPQARHAIRRSNAYSAKTDWPVIRLGIEYSF